jgi:hypothetical protein
MFKGKLEKKWRVRRSSPELFTPSLYLEDIITLPVIKPPFEISSLLVDYEEKCLSLRQIAAQKVHSRSTVQKNLKRADVRLRAPSHGHGNPAQLRFGFKKKEGTVSDHKGEQLIIGVIMDFRDDDLTFRQIAQRMTALNIPSKNGKKKWHPMMVKRVVDANNVKTHSKYSENDPHKTT